MLVVTRKANQTLCINDNEIKVVVIEVDGGQVKLGIDAPPHITVNREEVQIRINQSKQCCDKAS